MSLLFAVQTVSPVTQLVAHALTTVGVEIVIADPVPGGVTGMGSIGTT
jgi:hypothetical protein